MAQSSTENRSRPRRVRRVRYNYDSDSDTDLLVTNSLRTDRPNRSARRVPNYREESTEEDGINDTESSSERETARSRPQRSTRTRTNHSRSTRSMVSTQKRGLQSQKTSTYSSSFDSFKRRKITQQSSKQITKEYVSVFLEVPPSGKVPPWQELPYHILQSIMQYAAYPLYEKASRSTPSISWLCSVSMLCRSFHEACMTALLYSPPLYPSDRARGLLSLLKRQRSTPLTNYPAKIKCLDVEVKNLLIRKSGINLNELLKYTPLLERLRLYHNHDDLGTFIWAQPSASKTKWAYSQEIFDHLDDHGIILKFFEWNGRFPKPMEALQTMLDCHSRQTFRHLTEVSIINMSLLEKYTETDITTANSMFTSALEKLLDLKHLCIKNCNIINEYILPQIPAGLELLEISNCLNVTSQALELYLSSKGSLLRTLVLKGNQAMSLGFLADLKNLCPNLQHLEIDLTYIDPTSYRDRDPLFDDLLPLGNPTWPSTLMTISIENLRQLSAEEAEGFFGSLVSAAPDLPYLRTLMIKAILKQASWRDRAEMRKKWMPTFETVFLNTASPEMKPKTSKSSSRQSTRIAKTLNKLGLNDSNEDSESSILQSAAEDSKAYRQGRCDIVQLM